MWLMMRLMLVGLASGGVDGCGDADGDNPGDDPLVVGHRIPGQTSRPLRSCAAVMLPASSTMTSIFGADATSPSTDHHPTQPAAAQLLPQGGRHFRGVTNQHGGRSAMLTMRLPGRS